MVPDGYVISDHDVQLDRLPESDSVWRKSQVLVARVAIPAYLTTRSRTRRHQRRRLAYLLCA